MEAWPPSVQGAGSLPGWEPGPEAWAETGLGPAGPSVSAALASCSLSGPWLPWVMMAVCGRAAGQRRTQEVLLAPPKAAWLPPPGTGRGSHASERTWAAFCCPVLKPASPALQHAGTHARLSPCILPSFPACAQPSPSQACCLGPWESLWLQGLSIPARCPRADCQPWRLPGGATLPVALGQGCGPGQPDRAEPSLTTRWHPGHGLPGWGHSLWGGGGLRIEPL